MEREVLRPFLRFAQSVTALDPYIGRRIQDDLERGNRAEVGEGFDRSVRALLEAYCDWEPRPREVGADHHRVQSHREVPAALAALQRWQRSLAADFPAVPVAVDVREEDRGMRQLPNDRYLTSNQASIPASRGLDLLFTDRQMRDRGLDPRRDARRIHGTVLTLLPPVADVLVEART